MAEPVIVNYKDCQLEIRNGSEVWYSDDYQSSAVGTVMDDELIHNTVERFVYWIDKFGDPTLQVEQRCNKEDLETLGLHLYNLLFDREVRENPRTGERVSVRGCFERAIKNFEADRKRDGGLRLRLILKFHQEADKLASYPWEFLRVPRGRESFFIAGKKTELILTRCVPEAGFADKLDPEERPLKILIACSGPREEGPVEAEGIIKYIEGLKMQDTVEVDSVEYPTFKNIEAKIKSMKPHIFHFIGHGRVKDGKPEVALMRELDKIREDELCQEPADKRSGKKVPQAEWTGSATFAALFKEHQPRLVFLHACKGAATGYKFHSTARDLVTAKIPAVVAMQFEISNDDANAFAQQFYQHIDAGLSVDEAVSAGRWELGLFPSTRGAWNDRGFGTPVIYLQSKGAVISPRPREAGGNEQRGADAATPVKVPCPYPDCPTGFVIPGRNFCPTCRKPITLCPTPSCKANSVVMAKNTGFCDVCGYVAEASSFALRQSPSLVKADDAVGGKPGSVDIHTELTQ